MTAVYWAVAQTFSGMENLVRCDIEEMGKGAFLPSYSVTRVRRGRKTCTRRPLLPGYVFFQTSPMGWGDVACIKGVLDVARDVDGMIASRVCPLEMHRMMLQNASAVHNRIEIGGRPAPRNRSRKPRRSKRARISTSVKSTIGKSASTVHALVQR